MAEQQLNIRLDAIDNTKSALSSLKNNLNNLNNTTDNLKTNFLSLKNVILGVITGATLRAIINTTKEFENLRTTLNFITGTVQGGTNAFALIQNLAGKTQFSVRELSDAFITLYNSGINPTEELLTTFINTASVTANQLDTLNDLVRLFARGATGAGIGAQALAQLAAKGIPVYDILQKEIGLTRKELSKFADTAEGSEVILQALQRGLETTFAGASAARADNLSNALSNVVEQFKRGFDIIAKEGGFSDSLKDLLKSFTAILQTLEPLAKGFGLVLKVVTDLIVSGLNVLNKVFKEALNLYNAVLDKFGVGGKIEITIDRGQLEQGAIPAPRRQEEDKTFLGILSGEIKGELAKIKLEFQNINKIIADGVLQGIKSVSRGIAEAIVLGKSLGDTFRQIAQNFLVRILERIIEERLLLLANLAIKEFEKILNKEKEQSLAKQNSLLQSQLILENGIAGARAAQAQYGSGGGGGGFNLGSLLNIGSSIFGFAEGGQVNAGQPYTVGERGRELFIPSTNGTIVPNHDMAGGTNINFTINATDVKGVKELLLNNRATITNIVNQALNAKGKSNLI